jgi:hypothetical protein
MTKVNATNFVLFWREHNFDVRPAYDGTSSELHIAQRILDFRRYLPGLLKP